MHNLFLGVVQYHFRNVITIDKQASKAMRKPETKSANPKELDKGRAILESNPTASAMTRLQLPILQALVQEVGITLPNNARNTKKMMVEALLVVRMNDEDRMRVDTKAFVTEELVKEYAADIEEKNDQKGIFAETLTDEEINGIQAELKGIKRPSWHWGSPKNLGDAEHGKLKAEQWRLAIEFDLPVTLIKLWGVNSGGEERKQKLAHSTMLLTMAIRWGMLHVTSTHHTQQYRKYMKAYLECIRDVFPGHSFCPNHHACLHIDEFLLRYGPMHGWWMFPFERIIGGLQKTITNHKIGEMERTMLETFCTTANVKAMLQEPGAPYVVNKAAEILQRCCTPFAEEIFCADTSILRAATEYISHNDANIIKTPMSDNL
ncbi:hypothetical protein BDR04DRAFT_1010610 [Suillus decipiens]|nr:hypothetical protein BDR04DRAFT_1010610 [Suillus decipiens]